MGGTTRSRCYENLARIGGVQEFSRITERFFDHTPEKQIEILSGVRGLLAGPDEGRDEALYALRQFAARVEGACSAEVIAALERAAGQYALAPDDGR